MAFTFNDLIPLLRRLAVPPSSVTPEDADALSTVRTPGFNSSPGAEAELTREIGPAYSGRMPSSMTPVPRSVVPPDPEMDAARGVAALPPSDAAAPDIAGGAMPAAIKAAVTPAPLKPPSLTPRNPAAVALGASGPTPKPGQPYVGPVSGMEKVLGTVGKLAGIYAVARGNNMPIQLEESRRAQALAADERQYQRTRQAKEDQDSDAARMASLYANSEEGGDVNGVKVPGVVRKAQLAEQAKQSALRDEAQKPILVARAEADELARQGAFKANSPEYLDHIRRSMKLPEQIDVDLGQFNKGMAGRHIKMDAKDYVTAILSGQRISIQMGAQALRQQAADLKQHAPSTAAEKVLMETAPVKAQVLDLLQKLEPYKDINTPGYFAIPRAKYAIGMHSDDNDIAGSISELSMAGVIGAGRLIKGVSRSKEIFQKAQEHTPNVWHDSPNLMYSKLQMMYGNLDDIEQAAYTYGTAGNYGEGGPAARPKFNPRSVGGTPVGGPR